jgi:hopanoid biosynthesis associated RND transporter like protein HpnN
MATEQRPSHEEGIARLLGAWVAGVCRRPWLVLGVSLLLVGLSLFFTIQHLKYLTQRNELISPHKDYYQRWQQYVAEFGDDDDMVVVVRGENRARMKQALEALAREIEKQSGHFDRLFYKVDLRPLHNRALLFLPAEKIRLIQDNLKDMNLLLDTPVLADLDPLFSWKALTLQQLVLEGERRLATLQVPPAATQATDEQFLRQLDSICRSATLALDDSAVYQNPWNSIVSQPPGEQDLLAEPQYFFSGDGSLAFLLVRTVREDSFTGTDRSVSALRLLLDQLRPRFSDLEFGLTGLPVLENDEMIASQNDSNTAGWLALVGVALLYLVVYRSWRYPLYTVATLLVGTAWAMGWLTLTVGHLNILSASFAVMLIGMGDYGVLWVTRYHQERQGGADLITAMRITAGSVGPGILTAATTTALAFFATMLADFRAVVELGWIAGCGIILCALACFIVLPALLTLIESRFHRRKSAGSIISIAEAKEGRKQWLPALMHRPRLVIAVTMTVAMVLAFFALDSVYDHNLLHMQARGLESVKWEEVLISKTVGASWHALSYTTTPEEALALKARYERLPEVQRVVEAASLVPRDQEHKLDQLRDIQYRLRRLPKRGVNIPHALPRIEDLGRSLARLRQALHLELGTPSSVLVSLAGRLGDLQQRLANMDSAVAAKRLQVFQERLTHDLAEDLHRLREVSTPAPIHLTDLPAPFRERYIGRTGKWLVCVFAKDTLWEFEPLDHFVKQVQTVDPEATGKPFTTLEGLRAMKNGFLWAALYASLAMVLVLFLDFRSWKYTLLALAPLVMGVAATLGLMTLCHIPFNPANMIALPLILGVGADNGVHVLHDYRSRHGRVYTLGQATGRGILVAALTTILGFGTLMISSHRGIYSLGLALTIGVSCCMLTALIFLPALLRLKSLQHADKAGQAPKRHAA